MPRSQRFGQLAHRHQPTRCALQLLDSSACIKTAQDSMCCISDLQLWAIDELTGPGASMAVASGTSSLKRRQLQCPLQLSAACLWSSRQAWAGRTPWAAPPGPLPSAKSSRTPLELLGLLCANIMILLENVCRGNDTAAAWTQDADPAGLSTALPFNTSPEDKPNHKFGSKATLKFSLTSTLQQPITTGASAILVCFLTPLNS